MKMPSLNRKTVLTVIVLCVQIVVLVHGVTKVQGKESDRSYSFVYLGDIHFDRRHHHDFDWVHAHKPNDIRQIEGYVKNTEEFTPALLKRVQSSIESSNGRIKMIIQGGDLTEGLCGNPALQETQFREVRALICQYIPETPFIATKGNHDITGPGAREAFDRVMLPWLSHECEKKIDFASFYLMKNSDLFVFFDAYHNNSLDWLQKTLNENRHRHAFVVMHPPAVPYNARSSWHLFSREKEKDVRERFLNLLGAHNVVLLTAHLHKCSLLARRTSAGTFMQLSMNSVINSPNIVVRDQREGVENYGGSLVDLEPEFQPDTKQQRIKLLEDEKPYISYYEYADFPGYAIIHASEGGIHIDIYIGDSDKIWKNFSLNPAFDN